MAVPTRAQKSLRWSRHSNKLPISKLPLAFVIEKLCFSCLSARQVISTWRVLLVVEHGTCDPGVSSEYCDDLWMRLPPHMK